jgi:hypothetical protein
MADDVVFNPDKYPNVTDMLEKGLGFYHTETTFKKGTIEFKIREIIGFNPRNFLSKALNKGWITENDLKKSTSSDSQISEEDVYGMGFMGFLK